MTLQGPLTFAIGDVHGCEAKLVGLIEHCLEYARGRPSRFVCLGDYVDRGPDSAGVIDLLMERQRIEPGQFICLRGNHDDMLVSAADGDGEAHWLSQGGLMTLMSYGADSAMDLPDNHVDWLRNLPLFHRDELRIYVHAGLIPGLPLKQQPAEALMWIREPFLEFEGDHGFLVVHGHTPTASRRPDLRANRVNVDTGAVFGGPLTAAAFDDTLALPVAFITDDGSVRVLASGGRRPNRTR